MRDAMAWPSISETIPYSTMTSRSWRAPSRAMRTLANTFAKLRKQRSTYCGFERSGLGCTIRTTLRTPLFRIA